MVSIRFSGVHHVTSVAGDPQENVGFYSGVLGLRLVKKTVNFDDPGSYHLYYGVVVGTPDTIMTFFCWPGTPRDRIGVGQVGTTSIAMPRGSLDYWTGRPAEHGVRFEKPEERFKETVSWAFGLPTRSQSRSSLGRGRALTHPGRGVRCP